MEVFTTFVLLSYMGNFDMFGLVRRCWGLGHYPKKNFNLLAVFQYHLCSHLEWNLHWRSSISLHVMSLIIWMPTMRIIMKTIKSSCYLILLILNTRDIIQKTLLLLQRWRFKKAAKFVLFPEAYFWFWLSWGSRDDTGLSTSVHLSQLKK